MNLQSRSLSVLVVATLWVAGCSMSPEARKQRFLESGDAYFKDGKIAEAVIEYRNAVQIDGRFGPARLGLARSHEKLGQLPRALAEYVRAADLERPDPLHPRRDTDRRRRVAAVRTRLLCLVQQLL